MSTLHHLKRTLRALLSQCVTINEMERSGLTVREERDHMEREVQAIIREIERMKNQGVPL
jgi:hypothetical protein